jgi:hypothetical protein
MSVVVTVETPELDVDSGSSRDVVVRIRNTGDIVDRFTVTILGDTAAWTSVTPSAVNLYTGAEESVRLSFAPPRKSIPHARQYVYGVFVQSSEHPEDAVTEEGSVTVLAFTAAIAELVPQTSRGSGRVRHEVSVRNNGNVPVEAEILASDPDRLLRFETWPNRLALEPGASGIARLSVVPNETFLLGPPQSRQFSVTISSSGQEPFELRGAMLQSSRLPNWLPRAVAGVAVLAVVGGVMAAAVLRPPAPTPTQIPSLAVASPTLSPTPLASPSPSPSPSPGTTPSQAPPSAPSGPTPTPTPGEFVLAFVPDPGTTNGALSENAACSLEPGSACYTAVVETIRSMLTNLGGPYGGVGVPSPAVLEVANVMTLPILMERDVVFPWRSQTGVVDQTDAVVIDLAPLIANERSFAYAVVNSSIGPQRFVLGDDLANQLLATMYTVSPDMTGPVRTLPPITATFEPGVLQWQDPILPIQPIQP